MELVTLNSLLSSTDCKLFFDNESKFSESLSSSLISIPKFILSIFNEISLNLMTFFKLLFTEANVMEICSTLSSSPKPFL